MIYTPVIFWRWTCETNLWLLELWPRTNDLVPAYCYVSQIRNHESRRYNHRPYYFACASSFIVSGICHKQLVALVGFQWWKKLWKVKKTYTEVVGGGRWILLCEIAFKKPRHILCFDINNKRESVILHWAVIIIIVIVNDKSI